MVKLRSDRAITAFLRSGAVSIVIVKVLLA